MWDWLFQFIDPLERSKEPYAIVGSVAASLYGEPRATNDVDLVIQVEPADAKRLIQAFPSDQFYVPPEEVMLIEFARALGGPLNVIALESMTNADLYPLASGEQEWFSLRRPLEVSGRTVWFAAPEAVILHKRRYLRDGGGENTFVTSAECSPSVATASISRLSRRPAPRAASVQDGSKQRRRNRRRATGCMGCGSPTFTAGSSGTR